MKRFNENRNFMKSNFDRDIVSDQTKGLKQPPLAKEYEGNSVIIDLPNVSEDIIKIYSIHNCIANRKSNREYKNTKLSIEELSYLLWATQGVKEIRGDNYATVRPVASAGARHPFETYLVIKDVEGLKVGLYRYLPLEHKLLFIYEEDLQDKITKGTLGQRFISTAQVTFIWSCMPYRGEWRYDINSHKVMLIDAGHICQALYMACETLQLGTCAIAAYDQQLMDEIIKVDGEEEFVVYLAPVGKL